MQVVGEPKGPIVENQKLVEQILAYQPHCGASHDTGYQFTFSLIEAKGNILCAQVYRRGRNRASRVS
jgi:hypothetical protein